MPQANYPVASDQYPGISKPASQAQLNASTKLDPDTGTRLFVPCDKHLVFAVDATGNSTAAVGRIPISIGGVTKYLRYYND